MFAIMEVRRAVPPQSGAAQSEAAQVTLSGSPEYGWFAVNGQVSSAGEKINLNFSPIADRVPRPLPEHTIGNHPAGFYVEVRSGEKRLDQFMSKSPTFEFISSLHTLQRDGIAVLIYFLNNERRRSVSVINVAINENGNIIVGDGLVADVVKDGSG